MRLLSRIFLLLSVVYALGVLIFIGNTKIKAASAATDNNNIVISQIQIAGTGSGNADNEFIELYNPTNSVIDISKWSLLRESSSSASKQTLVSSMSGTIKSHGYFLIGSPTYQTTATILPDITYSATTSAITTNNTIVLYNGNPNTQNSTAVVIDKVGMGLAVDNETSDIQNPGLGQSVIRKATANSTAQTLASGGSEVTFGNGYDTDNNATDFVILSASMPRNSASPIAVGVPTPTNIPTLTFTPTPTLLTPTLTPTVTPTIKPTATPTNTPTPTATNTPTPTPTPRPTATPTPTIVPTATAIPTPTVTPTIVPTVTPTTTPTAIPTEIPTPTMSPTPTPPGKIIVNDPISARARLVCTETFRQITVLRIHFVIPTIKCSIIRA